MKDKVFVNNVCGIKISEGDNNRVYSKITNIQSEDKQKGIFKCLYTNIRSLCSGYKRDELELTIQEDNVDIIGVTESWTHEDIDDSEISIKGFSMSMSFLE